MYATRILSLLSISFLAFSVGCQDGRSTDDSDTETAALDTIEVPSSMGALDVLERDPYGVFLTDADGRALYLFTADSSGRSSCYDACVDAWPPLLATGRPNVSGEPLDQELMGTLTRMDGSTQATYNDWPLYYYAEDPAPLAGHDVHSFGGEWYLITPQGHKVEYVEETEESRPDSSSVPDGGV